MSVVELATRALLAAGRFTRPPPRRFTPGDGPVLVVAPHPDDETIGVGGTIALHAQAAVPVTCVVLTDGRGSREGGLAPDEMVRRRRKEVAAAVALLGIDRLVFPGLPEDGWRDDEAAEVLRPLLEHARIVYTTSCVDVHRDHLRVGHLVADLLAPHHVVRAYEVGVPLTPLLVNLVADVSAVAHRKAQALSCYATQRGALMPPLRMRSYCRSLYGLRECEVFWEMSATAFRAAMRIETQAGSRFRPVTLRPSQDIEAFVRGWRVRSTLSGVARRPESQ